MKKPSHYSDYVGQTALVYRNLHPGTFSVVVKGRVVAHADEVYLSGVSFKVRPAGRAKVLEQKQKNVHAFVKGTLTTTAALAAHEPVSYNPYRAGHFYDVLNEQPRHNATAATLTGGRIYVTR